MKLALLAAAWLSGLGLGLWLDVYPLPLLLLLLTCVPLGLLLRSLRCPVFPAILAATCLFGLLHAGVFHDPPEPLQVDDGRKVVVTGRIADDPADLERHTRLILEVESIEVDETLMSSEGKVLAYLPSPPTLATDDKKDVLRFGQALTVRGNFERPEAIEDFDYPAYLTSQGISGILWARRAEPLPEQGSSPAAKVMALVFDVRAALSASLDQALTHPNSTVANAILLGRREALPPDVTEDFRSSGAAHLLAISGLHVGILLVLTLETASWALGRRWGMYLLVPLASIWLYALVSGLPISVVRAAIMGTVYLAALALGRPRSALPALAFSAALMAGDDPRVLGQVSFQLSFAAMAGIVLALPLQAGVSERLDQRIRVAGSWWTQWAWQGAKWLVPAIIVSAAAALATWPLVAFHFNRVPLLGIVTTLLAMPSLPVILLGSFATAIAGVVHPVIGQILGWMAWLPISYLIALTSNMPSPALHASWAGPSMLWAWYGVIGGLMLFPRRVVASKLATWRLTSQDTPKSDPSRTFKYSAPSARLVLLSVALLAGASVLWSQLLARPDGDLRVYFLDVGQGDSTLIVTPGGKQVLIDGGPGLESATGAFSGKLPSWDRSLDLVVLTHLDDDHSRGIFRVLERYSVGGMMVGGGAADSPKFAEWQPVLDRLRIPRIDVESGFRVELEPGVFLQVLHPQPGPSDRPSRDRNNDSIVLRLVYDRAAFMFAADVEAEAEAFLARSDAALASTVLKVSHHGSRTSTTQPFLDRVAPLVAVVSAGENNSFGHPDPGVIARLRDSVGADRIYRTDLHGTIEVVTNGTSMWVRPER